MAAAHAWTARQRPARLERRLEFSTYESTRDFLDRAAALSERDGIYPDLSFGRTYVNITLHADDPEGPVGERLERFAEALDGLVSGADTP
jgi:4a-hydroxytetrahydrobiopterin dehydratase